MPTRDGYTLILALMWEHNCSMANSSIPLSKMKSDCPNAVVVTGGAKFDRSKRYRYLLTRVWEPQNPALLFIMLNPSTADERKNDPTISRCFSIAKRFGFGSFEVVNLFAYRTAYPKELKACARPVGRINDRIILEASMRAQCIVAAWGNWGNIGGRDLDVLEMLNENGLVDFKCLGTTRQGHPRHPLFLPADRELSEFSHRQVRLYRS